MVSRKTEAGKKERKWDPGQSLWKGRERTRVERHPGGEVKVALESQDWMIRDEELADLRGGTAWQEVRVK